MSSVLLSAVCCCLFVVACLLFVVACCCLWSLSHREQYALPSALSGLVDLVAGVKRLPAAPRPVRRSAAAAPRQGGVVSPQRSRQLWHVTGAGSASNGNKQEVAQFLVRTHLF